MPLPVDRLAAVAARGTSRLLALGAVGVIAIAACSPAPPTPPASPAAPSPAPSAVPSTPSSPVPPTAAPSAVPSPSPSQAASLLLEVRTGGGFINPSAGIGALPTVVVDTAGRIYLPVTAPDGPRPLVPLVQVRDTGAAGAAAILAAAQTAGLVDGTGGGGVAADTGSTVFTLEVNGSEVVTRVAGGGPVGGPGIHPGASGGPSAAPGAAAIDFLAKLTDPTTSWGGAAAAATTYTPTDYRVWVAPEAAGGTGGAAAAWPLTTDPNVFGSPAATNFGVDGLRSGVVTGTDAGGFAQALVSVPTGSDLSFAGHAYRVWVEPLLPVAVGS